MIASFYQVTITSSFYIFTFHTTTYEDDDNEDVSDDGFVVIDFPLEMGSVQCFVSPSLLGTVFQWRQLDPTAQSSVRTEAGIIDDDPFVLRKVLAVTFCHGKGRADDEDRQQTTPEVCLLVDVSCG